MVFGSPLIEEEDIREVVATLRSGWIGTGKKTNAFEAAFRAYKGAPHAVAVNSCTAALHLSLTALSLKPGDEVVTTPMTFCPTLHAIIHAGGTPVLADCDRKTMNIDCGEIERRITSRTRAVVATHFAGRPCAMDDLMSVARRYSLAVVEDCAHAIETEYHGRKAGTFGDFGCFSFYVTKNITTAEGGMVITANQAYAETIKVLALQGMTKDAWTRYSDEGYRHYQVISTGFKNNMTDIQAALGLRQLACVEPRWQRRKVIWERYNEAFQTLPCVIPAPPEAETRHAFHLYTLLLDLDRTGTSRDQILQELFERRIGTGVHYIAAHLHPYYAHTLPYKMGDFPNAEFISERTLSLPFSAKLSDEDVSRVIEGVREVLSA